MPWDLVLLLLFLALAVPFLGRRRMRQLLNAEMTTKSDRLRLYLSTVLSQWLAAAIILWRARARGISLRQLGWAIPSVSLAITVTVVLAGLILASQLLSLRQLASHPDEMKSTMVQLAVRIFPQDNVERLAFAGVVLTVALCEELIYRGFVQTLFQGWSGHVWIGIAGASLLFATAHLYQGSRGILSTLVVGICFSTVRWWTGSLLPGIVSHFVVDITVGNLARSRLPSSISPQRIL